MKKLLTTTATVLVLMSSAANAWTDGRGHWFEGPVGPYGDPPVGYRHEAPPAYGYPPPVYAPGYYPPSVVVVPPPTDAEVVAGTVLGIASMFARGRHW